MAPEQAKGVLPEIGERTDVFGLGRAALLHPDRAAAFRRRECERDADPRAERAIRRIPNRRERGARAPALCRIVRKAMSRAADDRHASVLELQEDVRGFLNVGLHFPSRVFPPGAVIVREGEPGDEAFIITSGNCMVVKLAAGRAAAGRPAGTGRRLRRDRDPVAHGAHRHGGRDR